MNFIEKARIRLEKWNTHNDHHREEYEMFAEQLEAAGKNKSSEHVRKMIALMEECNGCLRDALMDLE